MSFDPRDFVGSASRILPTGPSEADSRTAAGRAYYAVYGYLRTRLAAAKGQSTGVLFGKSGRHEEVSSGMAGLRPFKDVHTAYNGLLTLRVRADYRYDQTIDRLVAQSNIDQAEWVLEKLGKFSDSDFKVFPLSPR